MTELRGTQDDGRKGKKMTGRKMMGRRGRRRREEGEHKMTQ